MRPRHWLGFVVYLALCALLVFARPAQAVVSAEGQALIVAFEIGGPETYTRRYTRPVCPACATTASGPTIGVGYDLRHQRAAVILADWRAHPQRQLLASATGLGGQRALDWTRAHQHVVTPWPLAQQVFAEATLPTYWAVARRAFGPAFAEAPQVVQDALVSLVMNRGGSMVGPARAEMRTIRDVCLPRQDAACTARELRAMTRLWRGGTIEAGMTRRRHAEAAHAAR